MGWSLFIVAVPELPATAFKGSGAPAVAVAAMKASHDRSGYPDASSDGALRISSSPYPVTTSVQRGRGILPAAALHKRMEQYWDAL